MKKVGQFLLAVVMVAGLAGCPKNRDDSINVKLDLNANCSSSGSASGTVSNVETGYQTGTITVAPGQRLTIELPEAGLYYMQFENKDWYWKATKNLIDGSVYYMNCNP